VPELSRIFAPGLLDGKVALVTGGGTNLGKAAATELARCGAAVLIAGRRTGVLEAAAAEIGPSCAWVSGDIREPGDAARIVDTALGRFGALDVLVNNAGGQYLVPAEGITAKGWRAVMRLNVDGTTAMTEAAAQRAFLPGGRGGTVVTVTVSPHHGMPAMAHTGAARAAVEARMREFAHRWRDDGIRCVSAAIGRFDTESLKKYPAVLLAGAARSVPLGRLGRMEEFGWLVALLASPLGAALNGSVVTLDGAADNWTGPWPPPSLVDGDVVPTEERRPA
jgi:citronellol/citronellal dehydrogenase